MKNKNLLLSIFAIFALASCTKPAPSPTPTPGPNPDVKNEGKVKIEITNIKKAAYLYSLGVDLREEVSALSSPAKKLFKVLAFTYDYYSSISSWENGEDLKNKLETLLDAEDFVALEYTANWATNQAADESEINFDDVELLYSESRLRKDQTKSVGVGWDREHIFCASLLTGQNTSEATKKPGMATDFHNLYASATEGNNSRGNKNMGDVDPASANIDTDSYRSDGTTFEPKSSEDKGLASRALFYMATKYASEGIYLRENTCNTGDKCHGNLSQMIAWNNANAVTRHEYKHNESVYLEQHNRNPYVDFPELVDYVFGNKKDQAGTLESLTPSAVTLGIKDHENEFHAYGIGDVKYVYQIGETFKKGDLTMYAVYKDGTKGNTYAGYETSIADGFTFSEAGKFTNIVTMNDSEVARYEISVVADPVANSNYNVYFLEYLEDIKAQKSVLDTPVEYTFNNVKWNIIKHNSDYIAKNAAGVQFGTSSKPCNSITIESVGDKFTYDNLTDIEGIYFESSPASGETYTVSIYINDKLVKRSDVTREKGAGDTHYLVGITF